MIFSLVKVAEWPHLRIFCSFDLQDILCVFCLIVNLIISHFGFDGGTLVLIASVPGHCLSFTFYLYTQ